MPVESISYSRIITAPMLDALTRSFSSVSAFYAHDPTDADIWETMRRSVKARSWRPARQELSAALFEQNRRFGADERTLTAIRRLADPETLVIGTGQQTGLFTGPLYTVYKAITTLRLTRSVEKRLGVPVIPIFWMASDDHDFQEVNHAYLPSSTSVMERVELRPDRSEERVSSAHRRFGADIIPLIERLGKTCPESPYREEVIETLRESCPPEATFSEGFGRLMTRLFRGTGLVLVDPVDVSLKKLGRPVFEQEIRHPLASTRGVIEASLRLEKAGFRPQVERPEDAVNLFLYEKGQRHALIFQEGRFHDRLAGRSYHPEDLLLLLETAPERLSHNVITRPALQDALFPCLAYVGGPAEIAYYAQLGPVYRQFGLPFPIVYPRASLTLIDPAIARIMKKHDVTLDEFREGTSRLFSRRIRAQIPEAIQGVWRHIRTDIERHYTGLIPEAVNVDPTLERQVEAARRRSLSALKKLEENTLQALKRRNRTLRDQMLRIEAGVYPAGQPQERTLGVWPWIARYGFDFMDTLFEVIDETDFNHRMVWL